MLNTRNTPGIKYSTNPKCEPINGSRQYSDKPKCERARPFLYLPCAHNLYIPSPAQFPRGDTIQCLQLTLFRSSNHLLIFHVTPRK